MIGPFLAIAVIALAGAWIVQSLARVRIAEIERDRVLQAEIVRRMHPARLTQFTGAHRAENIVPFGKKTPTEDQPA